MPPKKSGRPKIEDDKKLKRDDCVYCEICGKTYQRASKIPHQKTKYHQSYAKYHKKLQKLTIKYLKPINI